MSFTRRSNSRKQEKPSFCSKRVLQTHHRNEIELLTLDENIKRIEQQKFNYNMLRLENIDKLHKISTKIKTVKTHMPISPDRRKFLLEHGFKMHTREVNIKYLVETINEVTISTKQERVASAPSRISTRKTQERPLLRLNQFVEHKKNLEEKKTESENKDESIEQKFRKTEIVSPKTNRLSIPIYIRKITPPLKGREVWKVHQEKYEENLVDRPSSKNKRPLSAFEKTCERRFKNKIMELKNTDSELEKEAEKYRLRLLSKSNFVKIKDKNAVFKKKNTATSKIDTNLLIVPKTSVILHAFAPNTIWDLNSVNTHNIPLGDKNLLGSPLLYNNVVETKQGIDIVITDFDNEINEERPHKRNIDKLTKFRSQSATVRSVGRMKTNPSAESSQSRPCSSISMASTRSVRRKKKDNNYSTMQVTIQGQTVSVFVPKFK